MNKDDKLKKAIVDKVSKKIREEREFIFEGISHEDGIPLGEFFEQNDVDDYIWEDDTLEDSLISAEDLNEASGDQLKVFNVGDIIMTTRFQSKGRYMDSPHRIMVVTSKKNRDGVVEYSGFLLSSKINKSNKMGGYPNNIYIKNYSSILYSGAPANKEAFIRVDDLVRFTSNDLSTSGSMKGKASREFMNFVQECYNNYRSGVSNSEIYWDK